MGRMKIVGRTNLRSGSEPGSLFYDGHPLDRDIEITMINYDLKLYEEHEVQAAGQGLANVKNKPGIVWLDVAGIHDVDVLRSLGGIFGLHPLVLEDILNTSHRPKLEDYGDYLFIVVQPLEYDAESGELLINQVSLVLGKNYVITIRQNDKDIFQPIKHRIKNCAGNIRRMGADYLAYSIIDLVIDNYFVALEGVEERIEAVENELVSRPVPQTLHAINDLKRDMLFIHRSLWPLREVINLLERGDSELVSTSIERYLKDLYDHTIQVMETADTFRDMLSGMLDIYLSSVSNRINEVMKVLTIIATIFIPLTFIVGVYGMNFHNMPELNWTWGYAGVWLLMLTIAGIMILFFRRKKWL